MSTSNVQTAANEEIVNGDGTLDREWLSSWIQPQHLKDDAIRSYREQFASHPANLVVVRNFLNEPEATALSNFVNDEAETETVYGLYSTMRQSSNKNPSVPEDEWTAAEEEDRFFRLRKFVRLAADKKLTPNLIMYLKFQTAFKDSRFRRFFEAITGLPFDLTSETYHFFTYKKGDFLGPHTDRGKNYSLAFMLYLTPEWEARFGGELNIVLPEGKVSKLDPEYNSLVAFNVEAQAKHFVSRIDESVGDRGRSAFSGWLHKPV